MADTDVAELERRVRAGEWLGPGAIADLLSVDRKTVHNWVTTGRIAYKRKGLRNRELSPADVLAILEEQREVRRAAQQGGDQ
jgi:predicted site-specific integrase-resolvase